MVRSNSVIILIMAYSTDPALPVRPILPTTKRVLRLFLFPRVSECAKPPITAPHTMDDDPGAWIKVDILWVFSVGFHEAVGVADAHSLFTEGYATSATQQDTLPSCTNG